MSKQVVLIRGLPGSGKTTLAETLATVHGNAKIFCAMDYMTNEVGEFCFVRSRLKDCHDACFDDFCEALQEGVPLVIADNCFISLESMDPYKDAARSYGYDVRVTAMTERRVDVLAARNFHRVPAKTIAKMNRLWRW